MPFLCSREVSSPQGHVLPPSSRWNQQPPSQDRWGQAGRFLDEDRLLWLENLLDEAFVLPGTNIRFGIDGIIGIIPGIGDVLAGLLSLLIPLAAWVRGVPYITLFRMLINVSIGLLVGAVPVFGDAFDIFWKANRRNYRLLTRSLTAPRRQSWRDWAFLLIVSTAITVIFAIPLAVMVWLLEQVAAFHPFH